MPKKIRQLKALLLEAGCTCKKAKGSHTKWAHPKLNDALILSGGDGDDAKPYQEAAVLRFVHDIPEEQ